MTYDQFDVVVVPFPFTDSTASKRRPALVISAPEKFQTRIGLSVLAMITTATHDAWSLDTDIQNLPSCGLSTPSIIRMKLFTLDNHIILRKAGSLDAKDKNSFSKNLKLLLGLK
jgi:mRNA interferase MazF